MTLQQPDDPSRPVRASDFDREATVERLRVAHADGRLTFDELAERSEQAYRSRTAAELVSLTDDLPDSGAAPAYAVAVHEDQRRESYVAIFSGTERKGHWRVPRRSRAVAVFGGIVLDMDKAELTAHEVRVEAVAVFGGIEIVVPEGVEVRLTGMALFGGKAAKVPPSRPGAPVVHVHANVVFGGLEVKTR